MTDKIIAARVSGRMTRPESKFRPAMMHGSNSAVTTPAAAPHIFAIRDDHAGRHRTHQHAGDRRDRLHHRRGRNIK
jgi:hypothetical protein